MRVQSLRRQALAEPTLAAVDRDVRLGNILVDAGEITQAEADRIAERQRGSDKSFGETAIALGFVSQDAIDRALAKQFDYSIADRTGARLDPALILANGWKDENSEAVRSLRAQLWTELASSFGPAPPSLTVAAAGAGGAVLACNLAIAFAQAGIRTLLVDGNMRAPRTHQLFGVPNQGGLSTFLARRHANPPIVPIEEIRGLALLPAGPIPPNPGELLARLTSFTAAIRETSMAEIILYATAPLGDCDDAYLIAAAAPAVLVVARRNITQSRMLAEAGRRFGAASARIVGAILDVS